MINREEMIFHQKTGFVRIQNNVQDAREISRRMEDVII
jgi:hypothetical protein